MLRVTIWDFEMKIKGLKAVPEKQLAEFKRMMQEETIPKIVSTMRKRQIAAAKARHRILFA